MEPKPEVPIKPSVLWVVIGVVLVGAYFLFGQSSKADKACRDEVGSAGVWVAEMKRCDCIAGFHLDTYYGECRRNGY